MGSLYTCGYMSFMTWVISLNNDGQVIKDVIKSLMVVLLLIENVMSNIIDSD